MLRLENPELKDVALKMMEYYGYYRQKYGLCVKQKNKDEPKWLTHDQHKLRDSLAWSHLKGSYAIGTFAGEHATKFITIDVDVDDRMVVRKVVTTMMAMGIPYENIFVSFSGKKGYHVDLFFKHKVMNDVAYRFYVMLLDLSGLAKRKVEFRPTNGQCAKMPLGMHQETGKRCWFVDPMTLVPIEDFTYILKIKPIEEEFFNKLVDDLSDKFIKALYKQMKETKENSGKGPREYSSLTVTAPGQRHDIQLKVAIEARSNGATRGGVYTAQMNWYYAQDHNLITTPEEDVMEEANQIADWVVMHIPKGERVIDPNAKAKTVYIRQEHIPYIINGKNETERKTAFIIWVYCLRFGSAKLAYKTLADKVGKGTQAVTMAVKNLVERKQIYKADPAYHEHGCFRLHDSNKYTVPARCYRKLPDGYENYPDSVAVTEWLTSETTERVYYSVITSMCSMEYLAKYLKKPELAKCMQYKEACENSGINVSNHFVEVGKKEGVSADGGAGAAADA